MSEKEKKPIKVKVDLKIDFNEEQIRQLADDAVQEMWNNWIDSGEFTRNPLILDKDHDLIIMWADQERPDGEQEEVPLSPLINKLIDYTCEDEDGESLNRLKDIKNYLQKCIDYAETKMVTIVK